MLGFVTFVAIRRLNVADSSETEQTLWVLDGQEERKRRKRRRIKKKGGRRRRSRKR